VDVYKLESELGYSHEQARSVRTYLESKNLISFKCKVPCVRITPDGIDEAVRIMAETYRSKEQRVLQKLYDERQRRYTNPHQPDELARELGLDLRETQDIVVELERKGLTEGNDQATWIAIPGIEFIESGRQLRGEAGTNISYTTNVNAPIYGGLMQGTHDSTQNITLTNHQPIGEILPKLVELIEAIKQADFLDKEDVVADLEKAHQLAQGEQTEGSWKRIQAKLNAAKTTMEISGMAYKSLPYWPLIWEYFHHIPNLIK
jgi:hypothetical protein